MKTARARAGDAAFNAGCVVLGVFMQPHIAENSAVFGYIIMVLCALLTGWTVWLALDVIIIAIEASTKEPIAQPNPGDAE